MIKIRVFTNLHTKVEKTIKISTGSDFEYSKKRIYGEKKKNDGYFKLEGN